MTNSNRNLGIVGFSFDEHGDSPSRKGFSYSANTVTLLMKEKTFGCAALCRVSCFRKYEKEGRMLKQLQTQCSTIVQNHTRFTERR